LVRAWGGCSAWTVSRASRRAVGTHPAFCHSTIQLHTLPCSADTCAPQYSSVEGSAFLRTDIIARLMRSFQPVLGPVVSESLQRRTCVYCCQKTPWLGDSVSPSWARGERRELRCAGLPVSGWTFVFFREKRNEPSLLSVTWAIRLNGRVTRGTG